MLKSVQSSKQPNSCDGIIVVVVVNTKIGVGVGVSGGGVGVGCQNKDIYITNILNALNCSKNAQKYPV